MLKFQCIIIFLFLSISSFSQNRERLKEKTFDPSKFKEFSVKLEFGKKDKKLHLHYANVHFLDDRADKSKLGFVLTGEYTEYHRIIFPKTAEEYLNERIAQYLLPDSAKTGSV